MVKKNIKRQKPGQKHVQHHWLLISIFAVIILLGVTVFILQRTSIKAIAGEAIQQRIAETKQLALSDEEAKVAAAIEVGKENIMENCPPNLKPAVQQLWSLEGSWKFKDLQIVGVQCSGNTVSCYYADDGSEINRADQVVIYNVIPKVNGCKEEKSGNLVGCNCEIVAE
ncbi:MAG: hypothetical protein Q7S55_01150 [Nanoarchaeota archaeon]|nr:hypothetical protein [Nanoarchaeota archaeon]